MENKDKLLTVEYLMKWHELNEQKAKSLLEFCDKHTIRHESCYGDGSIMFPKWLETQSDKVDKTMINMENREEMHIKQMNAEENYMTTPISVLSYITALEEQNKALLDEIDMLKFQLKAADSVNENLSKQEEWISVEDRLPEINGMYLVFTDFVDVATIRSFSIELGFLDVHVTHWMPLPNQPK